MRVVRRLETKTLHRQLPPHVEEQQADWVWVTTLPKARAGSAAVLHMGHGRWTIENPGFNEMVDPWYADHVYKHEPRAIPSKLRARLNFWLLAMACLPVFRAFYGRNLKPALRRAANMLNVARRIAAELHIDITANPPPRSAVSVGPDPGTPGPHRHTSPQTGSPLATEDPRLLSRKTPPANLPHTQNARKLRHFQHFRTHLRNRRRRRRCVAMTRPFGTIRRR